MTAALESRSAGRNDHAWIFRPLAEVADILDSKRIPVNGKEREGRSGTVPYYGATGQVGWIDDWIFEEELVLLGEDGAPFLDSSKVKAYCVRGKTWVNNHAHVLRATAVPSSWLLHYLNAIDYRHLVTGTTRLKLTQAEMRKIQVPVASDHEMAEVVAEIEKQFSRLDEAVANLQRAKSNVQRYERSVLDEAVGAQGVEPMGQLPAGWQWKALPELGELGRGKSKHRPRDDARLYGGPFPFLQTGDVRRSGGLIKEFTQTYTEFGLAQSRLWPEGTLCITIAANIAETGILAMPACFPDSVVGFLSGDKTLTRFVEFFMRTAREDLERFAPATAQKNINLAVLERVMVPTPGPAERERILAEVDCRLSIVREIEAAVDANLKRAQALRQAVLAKAFGG